MPGHARKDLVREGEIGTYHCWSRCVQRAFLCGYDPVTARDFDYRRGWIESLLAYLAGVFALDVGNYNILANHLHALLRTRPDVAALWSPEEVALRWKLAWPELRDGQWVREPTDAEVAALLGQPGRIEQLRRRLSSLSWFMARWKEPIARLCNAEMETSGHFWDARFRCRELLDDAAVLTCSFYVDLNQIRAGLAASLEASRYSAICQRLLAAQQREAQASYVDVQTREPQAGESFTLAVAQALFADCHLTPIAATGRLLTTDALLQAGQLPPLARGSVPGSRLSLPESVAALALPGRSDQPADSMSPPTTATDESQQAMSAADSAAPTPAAPRLRARSLPRRASDVPFLAVTLSEYLRLVRTLASRIVGTGTAPSAGDDAALHATLARWGLNPAAWLAQFQTLDRRCTRALGPAERVLQRAREVDQQRFNGIQLCRDIFAAAPAEGFT
jgi:hypothetical protein